jgi:hypothetical protein
VLVEELLEGKGQGGGRLLLKHALPLARLGCVRRWHKLEHRQSDDAQVKARSRPTSPKTAACKHSRHRGINIRRIHCDFLRMR